MNKHTRSRKRQALNSININIQQRHDRKTFDYCMKYKVSLCVFIECFTNYHEAKEVAYKVLWCIISFRDVWKHFWTIWWPQKSSECVQIRAIECLNTNEAPLSIIHVYRQYWWCNEISMIGVGNTKKRAKISLIGCGGDASQQVVRR